MAWELNWIENRARLHPEKIAIVDAESKEQWTYSQLNQRSMRAARWLVKNGINKGDRVALLSPNSIGYFDLLFACAKIGAIFVPMNWRLSSSELAYILQDCSPKLIGYHSSLAEKINTLSLSTTALFRMDEEEYLFHRNPSMEEVEITDVEPLAIIYTGGTTGKPKGVVLSHQSIIWNGMNTILSWNLTSDDVTVNVMPMFHTGGLNALAIPILMIGGKVVLVKEYQPEEMIQLLVDYQCSIVLFVPTMYHMMIHTPLFNKQIFPNHIIFLSGAAPCPLEIYDAFQRKGLFFKEGYGLSEAGPNNFYMDVRHVSEKMGSVGKPMMFNRVKIVQEDGNEAPIDGVGELLIQGKHLFHSYWKNQKATNETLINNWLYTGDLARKDKEGFYYIVGRKKDMIISGGENVYPLEVEQCISNIPQVKEVAVIGTPDPRWGEKVIAYIVLKDKLSIGEIQQYCKVKIAHYKVPKEIIIIEELPKTFVGKIDKKKLLENSIHKS